MKKTLKTLDKIKLVSIFTFERTNYVSFSDYCNIHKDFLGKEINVIQHELMSDYFNFNYNDKEGKSKQISIYKECFQ